MKYLKYYNKINESIIVDSKYITKSNHLDSYYKKNYEFINEFDDPNIKFKLYKTKDDYFFIVNIGGWVISYEYLLELQRSDLKDALEPATKALYKLLEPLRTYKFQKEFIDNHPERIDELKIVGYNTELLNDPKYTWLFEQESNGFFGLKIKR